jgi:hypothetical protein
MQADGGDALVGHDGLDALRNPDGGLVAQCDQIGQVERALLHRQIDCHIAALGDQGDAALDAFAAMLVRPQGRAIQVVDEAVAVRPHHRHGAGGGDQPMLTLDAGPANFPETRGKANDATGARSGEELDRFDRRFSGNRDEDGVWGLGQILQPPQAITPGDAVAPGVDRPDRPLEPQAIALLGDDFRLAAADQGNVSGPQQALQGLSRRVRHAYFSSGRRMEREMMWRWISDVPSQIRSTRASRQKRSSGKSSINPMPPWIWIASSVTRASISEA